MGACMVEFDPELAVKRGNLVKWAGQIVDRGAEYRFHWEECDPPDSFNCALLVAWLLEQAGLFAPKPSRKLLTDLFVAGHHVQTPSIGDLVFCDFPSSTYRFSLADGRHISHVGMFVGSGQVVHASGLPSQRRVVCESFLDFCRRGLRTFVGYVALPLSKEKLAPCVEEDLGLFV